MKKQSVEIPENIQSEGLLDESRKEYLKNAEKKNQETSMEQWTKKNPRETSKAKIF